MHGRPIPFKGVYTMGEWYEMHHGENWGDFVMIMMLLLVSIILLYQYIYYLYTRVLLTCCLPFFLY